MHDVAVSGMAVLCPNTPVVIKGLMNNWPAMQETSKSQAVCVVQTVGVVTADSGHGAVSRTQWVWCT